MATAKQRAWRAKFARLYGRKKKSRQAARSPKVRRVKVMARRRRSYRKPRRYFRKTSKGYSISLLSVAHYAVQYSNLTGQELGTVLTALISSIMSGDDSFLDIVIGQVNAAIANVTEKPVQTAIKGAVIAMVFSALKKAVGSRKLIGVGKFSIRV